MAEKKRGKGFKSGDEQNPLRGMTGDFPDLGPFAEKDSSSGIHILSEHAAPIRELSGTAGIDNEDDPSAVRVPDAPRRKKASTTKIDDTAFLKEHREAYAVGKTPSGWFFDGTEYALHVPHYKHTPSSLTYVYIKEDDFRTAFSGLLEAAENDDIRGANSIYDSAVISGKIHKGSIDTLVQAYQSNERYGEEYIRVHENTFTQVVNLHAQIAHYTKKGIPANISVEDRAFWQKHLPENVSNFGRDASPELRFRIPSEGPWTEWETKQRKLDARQRVDEPRLDEDTCVNYLTHTIKDNSFKERFGWFPAAYQVILPHLRHRYDTGKRSQGHKIYDSDIYVSVDDLSHYMGGLLEALKKPSLSAHNTALGRMIGKAGTGQIDKFKEIVAEQKPVEFRDASGVVYKRFPLSTIKAAARLQALVANEMQTGRNISAEEMKHWPENLGNTTNIETWADRRGWNGRARAAKRAGDTVQAELKFAGVTRGIPTQRSIDDLRGEAAYLRGAADELDKIVEERILEGSATHQAIVTLTNEVRPSRENLRRLEGAAAMRRQFGRMTKTDIIVEVPAEIVQTRKDIAAMNDNAADGTAEKPPGVEFEGN